MPKVNNPSRRQLLKAAGATAVAGTMGLAAQGAGKPAKARGRGWRGQPNILLMLVDEMRFPPVYEAQGLKDFRAQYLVTQNMLRANGVEFNRHYAASTACAPSRASIFTGHYPSLHGVTNTTGAAKEANDPDVFWLDPGAVPTMGDYFRAGGYRTFYKGKWHASNADLQIPGTHDQLLSYDDMGTPDPAKEQLYFDADRLDGFGFGGWIGPEPHGKAPLNTGASPAAGQGRDEGFAAQVVGLIDDLDARGPFDPWLMVASFVNPHDIALWGYAARFTGLFDFSVEAVVPTFSELFTDAFALLSVTEDLSTKPTCQTDYQESYSEWMQGIPPDDYWRFYYQLHKDVDAELLKVYDALRQSRFFDNTIVVFTSDHGDLLGAHHYMHQKWYQAYDEALRVPLIISNERLFPEPASVNSITSHVDLLPTLLGLAGLDPADLIEELEQGHSDVVPLVGRNLQPLVVGDVAAVTDPIYFMTDDDMSRGLDQENWIGIAYDSVGQPNHIESVIVEIDSAVWKYSRYFDNPQFWSNPEPDTVVGEDENDVVIKVREGLNETAGVFIIPATKRVKFEPEPDQFEMYNVTQDPLELDNLIGQSAYAGMQQLLADLLVEQTELKRLRPVSGDVPGQPE